MGKLLIRGEANNNANSLQMATVFFKSPLVLWQKYLLCYVIKGSFHGRGWLFLPMGDHKPITLHRNPRLVDPIVSPRPHIIHINVLRIPQLGKIHYECCIMFNAHRLSFTHLLILQLRIEEDSNNLLSIESRLLSGVHRQIAIPIGKNLFVAHQIFV